MGTTNMLLREILQEIRNVKTHGIPPSVPVPPVLSSAGSGSGRSISPTGLLTSSFSLGGKVKNAEIESIKAGIKNGRYSRQGSERESNLAKARSMLKWYNNAAAKGKEGGKAFQSRRNYARNLVNSLAHPSAVASAGGGVNNVLSHFEKERLASSKKAPTKVVAQDLYFNPAMDCFVNQEGNCFYSNLNETTLDPIANMDRKIGTLRPGIDREKAQPSNFIASNARSQKRKNRRNCTRKN